MRLTIVQYAGDYADAYQRFDEGGKATYQAQRYSVGFVGSLAERLDHVAVVCALADTADDILLPNNVQAIRAGLKPGFKAAKLIPIIARTEPDCLLLTTPMIEVLRWARLNGVRTATTFADSFQRAGIRTAIRNYVLARELQSANVEWVGNHGIAACLSLRSISVSGDKIIPWDWPPSHSPDDYSPRHLRRSGPFTLVYVGSISEVKGVGDLLHALKQLSPEKRPMLNIIGNDKDGTFKKRASALALERNIRFAGMIPNEDVPAEMRRADAVIIPSRHEYPEGLPLTIYEALAARTPIIASDHPMFRGALTDNETALVFPAGNSQLLAASIQRISLDSELYARLSKNSESAWRALQLPVSWGEFIERWLFDKLANRKWLWNHRLTSGLYDDQIAARAKLD